MSSLAHFLKSLYPDIGKGILFVHLENGSDRRVLSVNLDKSGLVVETEVSRYALPEKHTLILVEPLLLPSSPTAESRFYRIDKA